MASSKEYLEFILGQLSELEDITYRTMMGEFIIYYRGKVVGGIYDDRLLVKPVMYFQKLGILSGFLHRISALSGYLKIVLFRCCKTAYYVVK